MNLVVLYVKLFKRKPEKVYKWEPMQEDVEVGHETYPMVLVQIPMYNEKEVSLRAIYVLIPFFSMSNNMDSQIKFISNLIDNEIVVIQFSQILHSSS